MMRTSPQPTQRQPAQQAYDRLASIYDRRWKRYVDVTLDRALEDLDLAGRARVLDVACGTGELIKRLHQRWPDLHPVGTDLSRGMLEQATAKLPAGTVQWVQADAAHLPFAGARFDTVLCINSFHYLRQPHRALREMRRVLRPGGQLLVLDWCDDYLTCKLCSLYLRWTDPAFYRTYSLRACRHMLEQAGFTVTATTRFRTGWLWGLMRLHAAAAAG